MMVWADSLMRKLILIYWLYYINIFIRIVVFIILSLQLIIALKTHTSLAWFFFYFELVLFIIFSFYNLSLKELRSAIYIYGFAYFHPLEYDILLYHLGFELNTDPIHLLHIYVRKYIRGYFQVFNTHIVPELAELEWNFVRDGDFIELEDLLFNIREKIPNFDRDGFLKSHYFIEIKD